MALRILDSGEATRFPSFAARSTSGAWAKVPNQPSKWECLSGSALAQMGIDTSDPFTGSTHFRLLTTGAQTNAMRRSCGADLAESWVSIMIKPTSLIAQTFLTLFTSASAISVRLDFDAAGQLLTYAGTTPTLKATIPSVIAGGAWTQIRLHQKTSSNTLEIMLEDGSIVDCSGTAMGDWRYICIGHPSTTNISEVRFDNVQANDANGSVNNSWPGTPRIPSALRPDADGAATDWVRNTGSADYETVDEVQPDLDTTYISSDTDDDESSFGFSALAEPSNAVIIGVVLTVIAKRSDAAQIIPTVTRGGSTVELDPVDVGVDYMNPIEVIIEEDPIASSAWTQSNLNATEFGVKHVAI